VENEKIRVKWQQRWLRDSTFVVCNDSNKPKYYVLDMFPYPSGNGLHVGHAVGYIGTDIIARYYRMKGYNVLHPMGWDAFGLPAEQYAIKTGTPPALTTKKNCENFKRQLQLMGLSYDWNREIDTSSPDYFKWTQFLFLKLYEKGLVYESEEAVWWCEELKSVLANEEVIQGRSERGDFPCVKKKLKQWVIKITDYAGRLLSDLEELDWPESVKKMQREWIGRSNGVDIKFTINGLDGGFIEVFSTCPEMMFGVNALIISTDHHLLNKLVAHFLKKDVREELSRIALSKDEILGFFTGVYAIHPITHQKLPVYVSNYIVGYYACDAVMCVPAYSEHDKKFSKKMGLNWKAVLTDSKVKEDAILKNSNFLNGLSIPNARKCICEWLVKNNIGKEGVRYKLRDWLFSRQRYWGEPFPLYKNSKNEITPAKYDELPICLPTVDDYAPASDGSSPLQRAHEWIEQTDESGNKLFRITDTMPGWAGSCWYYLRFIDPKNDKEPFSQEAMKYWGAVDLYVGGAAHATMHLIYSRFWHKVLYDLGMVNYKEPFKKLFNQGLITAEAFKDETGRIVAVDGAEKRDGEFFIKGTNTRLEKFNTKMSKSLLNVVTPDDMIHRYGVDAFRLHMMFLGPLDKDKKWDLNGIIGCERFILRVWSLFCDEKDKIKSSVLNTVEKSSNNLWAVWQRILMRVTASFNDFNFNIAVAAFMEFINFVDKEPANFDYNIANQFLRALSPFAPHVCEELWEKFGQINMIANATWPKCEFKQVKKLKVMVNGKFIDYLEELSASKEENKSRALEMVSHRLRGKIVSNIVYVEGKIINIVITN